MKLLTILLSTFITASAVATNEAMKLLILKPEKSIQFKYYRIGRASYGCWLFTSYQLAEIGIVRDMRQGN